MLRKIYMIEVISAEGDLIARRYASNKRTAEKIAKQYGEYADVRSVRKDDWCWIDSRWVERSR